MRRDISSEEGVTLVEVMIAAALMTAVITPTLMFLTSTQRGEIAVQEANAQLQGNRLAVERMTRSMRDAGFADTLTYEDSAIFVSAADMDTTLYTDLDHDGVTEKVRYYLTGSALKRSTVTADCSSSPCTYGGAPSSVITLVGSVRNSTPATCGSEYPANVPVPVFEYYRVDRATGVPTIMITPTVDIADLVDINYVEVKLMVDITPDKAPICSELDVSVALRNWRG